MPLLHRWLALRETLSDDFLGGPKVVKLAWPINLQKGGTLFFVLALMFAFDNFTPTAWTYAALHGSYGLVWLLKELIFPDPGWQKKVTIGAALNAWLLVLGLYWIAPVLLIVNRREASPAVLASATILFVIGIVLMVGSDAQKFFVLRARRGLITDGFFARVRNPNYLGEMMLYGSFAVVAGHIAPWIVLLWVWSGVFFPNMLRKDESMARYPEWPAYRARTGLLLPRLRVAGGGTAALLGVLGVSSCVVVVEGDGQSTTQTRELSRASEVDNHTIFDAEIEQRDQIGEEQIGEEEGPLTVVCDGNLLEHIVTEVDGNVLSIRVTPKMQLAPRTDCLIKILLPSLQALRNFGVGEMSARGALDGLYAVVTAGTGAVSAEGIRTDELLMTSSGVGDTFVAGNADVLRVDNVGTGSAHAESLQATDAVIRLSGTGDVLARVANSVEIELTGTGDVRIAGNPPVRRVEDTGTGAVSFDE